MGYIKHPNRGSGVVMLIDNAAILYGHRPSSKLHHATIMRIVPAVKGCLPAVATDMSRRKEANFVTPIKENPRYGTLARLKQRYLTVILFFPPFYGTPSNLGKHPRGEFGMTRPIEHNLGDGLGGIVLPVRAEFLFELQTESQ